MLIKQTQMFPTVHIMMIAGNQLLHMWVVWFDIFNVKIAALQLQAEIHYDWYWLTEQDMDPYTLSNILMLYEEDYIVC